MAETRTEASIASTSGSLYDTSVLYAGRTYRTGGGVMEGG